MTNRIEKVVDIKNGKIIFRKVPNGYITFFQITYIKVDEENNAKKRLQFSMWDDFQFEGAPREYELFDLEKIDFDIEKENILYGPIKRFLGEDKEFILDDDATWGINNKVMKISENKDDIKIEFINNGKGQEEQGNNTEPVSGSFVKRVDIDHDKAIRDMQMQSNQNILGQGIDQVQDINR